MNSIKGFINKTWHYGVGTFILSVVIVYYAVFNQSIQLFHYDMMEQGIRFVQRAWDLYREPGFELWDWTHYFGASVFVHQYMLYSPFWLILVFLPSKLMIPVAFLYVNMGKHILLYIFSVLYFRKLKRTKLASVAGALIITFSGFALGYYNYANFTDVFLFLPLVLYFIEDYLDYRKGLGLVLSISIMALINVYLFLLFTSFIFLYTLMRYCVKGKFQTIQLLLVDGLKFIGLFLLALGLASVLFLPSIEILLSTSRITSGGSLLRTITSKDAFRYITGFLQPIVDRNNFNPLVNKFIVPSYGHSGGAAVYSLILTPILLPQLFVLPIHKFERLSLFVFYAFLSLISIFPGLYVFLQGNSDTRWMYMFIMLNAYSVSLILDHRLTINRFILTISIGLVGLGLGVSYIVSRHWGLQNNELYYEIAKRNVLLLGLLIVLYGVVFIFINKKSISAKFIVLLITFDASFSMYNMFFNPVDSISMSASEVPSYHLADESIIQAIKDTDGGVYRIDAIENYNFNEPLGKNYMGFTFYSNIYDYEVDTFILNNISSGGGWVVGANAGKWQYKEMFGAKYWFDLTGGAEVPYGYLYQQTVEYGDQPVDVYVNQYPVPLVYTMSQSLNYETWKGLNSLDKFRALMSSVVTENSQNEGVNYAYPLQKLSDFGTQASLSLESAQMDSYVYVVLPRSEEVKLKFSYQGVPVKEYYSYEPNYSGVYVKELFDHIDVEVTNLYGVPESEFINSIYIETVGNAYQQWYQDLSKGFVEDLTLGLNSFSGTIHTNTKQWVVTSIAYDRYWSLTVDGEKVAIQKVNGGFIGFEVQAGTHTFEASYQPLSFYFGIMVSIISLLILIFYTWFVQKTKFHP